MPSDANGVHSLPVGYLAEDGDTIQPSQHNPPLEDLSSGLTERLMRSGVAPMTGPLKLADGTAGAPGLAFNSDPTAGFYLSNNKIIPTKPLSGIFPVGLGPLPWSRMTPPLGWVLCYGQTLNRVTYPDLWTVAQAEITAANPLYNNGDGSTTFGILDMRGIGAAGYDVMGGAAASRLPGALGVLQGLRTATLTQANLPSVNFNVIEPNGGLGHYHTQYYYTAGSRNDVQGGTPGAGPSVNTGFAQTTNQIPVPSPTGIAVASGGSGTPLAIVQPTIPLNFILYAGA